MLRMYAGVYYYAIHGHWPCHACTLVYFHCFHVAPPANPTRLTRKPANFHPLCCLNLRITYACIVAPLATETCDTIMALMAILRCRWLQTTVVYLACIFLCHFSFALIIIHSCLYILLHAYLPEVNLQELIGNGFDQQDGVQGS